MSQIEGGRLVEQSRRVFQKDSRLLGPGDGVFLLFGTPALVHCSRAYLMQPVISCLQQGLLAEKICVDSLGIRLRIALECLSPPDALRI